jgi:ElaB/YqjD/DUF883 family membrane-anchored ribosome-binding protein
MFSKSPPLTHNTADGAAQSIEHAVQSTQRTADQALDRLAGTPNELRPQVAPLLERAGEQAGALAQRSADAVRERAQQLRAQTTRVSDGTLNYIKDEPVKAVLIAAAAGAALVALLGLLRKPA